LTGTVAGDVEHVVFAGGTWVSLGPGTGAIAMAV